MNTDRDHLDAETVAAWMDGGLDAMSLAAAEAHAGNCERCQALLVTVARTLPAEENGSVTAAVTPETRSIWRWWMAPVAAAAAAATLWMVVPQDLMRPPASTASQSDVGAEAQAQPSTPQSAPAAPAVARARQKPANPSAEAGSADSRRDAPQRESEAKRRLENSQPNNVDTIARNRQEKRESVIQERAAVAAPLPPPPAAAAPPAPAEAVADRSAATGAQLGAVAQLRKENAPLELVSPVPSHRWRVMPGAVEFSSDGGRTWMPVRISAGGSITAGASPAPLVCWLVGRRGLVLLATDGTNFTRLSFPEPVDLVSVTATDALRATVATADGRTFQTADNGRNWRNP